MEIRKLTKENVEDIYNCLLSNDEYNKMSNDEVSRKVAEDMLSCRPPGIMEENKTLYGAFEEDKCIGISDVIFGYPDKETSFIGLLMIDGEHHKQGYGKRFYELIEKVIDSNAYKKIALGVLMNNMKGYTFWQKQGYVLKEIRKRKDTSEETDIKYMEKEIKNT
ncbi:GNAT family N-acetyltransferase [Anaerorhabdus furcosa]|uniref:Ribosomal protein S18 acetylase RimI n=1 Tax=Anaerorhabdus furcosa TaxID=118967 RepID=A0A1T4KT49_9FIRM|nr:GNAT family N-acetyltransferase [Anaerorhabdus furcosa]SJZ45612.1 Ribosomal protein S18 acetylase RimI [Anaerorhabdus furcosa]